MKTWIHDPQAKRTYRQKIVGDTISSAVWAITPSGPTLGGQSDTTEQTTIQVSGLTLGTLYNLKVTVTCASGQIIERTSQLIARSE